MRSIQWFDKQFPAPSDHHIMGVYKQFLAYQNEVTKNWTEEVINQLIAYRNFVDLKDARLRMVRNAKGDSTPIISLKPFIGFDVQEQLDFYIRLFDTYAAIRDGIIDQIGVVYELRTGELPDLDRRSGKYNLCINTISRLRMNIAKNIMRLKIMITAANDDKLTMADLDAFNDQDNDDYITALARSYDLGSMMPKVFHDGGNYYDQPNLFWVEKFYGYAHKKIDRLIDAQIVAIDATICKR